MRLKIGRLAVVAALTVACGGAVTQSVTGSGSSGGPASVGATTSRLPLTRAPSFSQFSRGVQVREKMCFNHDLGMAGTTMRSGRSTPRRHLRTMLSGGDIRARLSVTCPFAPC